VDNDDTRSWRKPTFCDNLWCDPTSHAKGNKKELEFPAPAVEYPWDRGMSLEVDVWLKGGPVTLKFDIFGNLGKPVDSMPRNTFIRPSSASSAVLRLCKFRITVLILLSLLRFCTSFSSHVT
jgi:hypothetical protein